MTINVPAPFNSICYKILIKSVNFFKIIFCLPIKMRKTLHSKQKNMQVENNWS